ncbi:MAG TPA: cation diffusion facilitator family transporter [Candidatus Deferrimicrobium sp.]|nr:cation diffusion facilitator family transporter [Candidatus Deferrimicrobium sp.]
MSEIRAQPRVSARKLVWVMLFNLGITVAEVIGGLVTGYLALLADAVHNLSDVAALGLAWLGVKGSEKPATKKSTYGYKRIEVMTALISAVALIVIAIFILLEAYRRLRHPQPISQPAVYLSVAVIGLLGNLFSIYILRSERTKSLNMKAAFLHRFYDAASSVVVIAAGLAIVLTGWYTIDVILSAAIALLIFWSSYFVIKEAVLIFLEAVPYGVDFDAVLQAILEVPKVRDVHDLHIWSLSSHETALSCHVSLDEPDFQDGPNIIVEINRMLKSHFNIGHGTLQIEKFECGRPDLLCRYSDHRWE